MIKKITIILVLFFTLAPAQASALDKAGDSQPILQKTIRVPHFSLTDIQGKVHTDKSTQGKFLVVNFWATWCPPCLKEIPAFVDFYKNHQDKVLILGLNHENADKKTIMKFTDKFSVNYPIVLFSPENAGQFEKFGRVLGLPTTYIYAADGRLVDYRLGELRIEDLQKIILSKF